MEISASIRLIDDDRQDIAGTDIGELQGRFGVYHASSDHLARKRRKLPGGIKDDSFDFRGSELRPVHPDHRRHAGDDRRGERGTLGDRVRGVLLVEHVHGSDLEVLDEDAIALVVGIRLEPETQVQVTEIIVGQIRLQAAAAAAFREDECRLPVKPV